MATKKPVKGKAAGKPPAKTYPPKKGGTKKIPVKITFEAMLEVGDDDQGGGGPPA